jgi:hypothetical protein
MLSELPKCSFTKTIIFIWKNMILIILIININSYYEYDIYSSILIFVIGKTNIIMKKIIR